MVKRLLLPLRASKTCAFLQDDRKRNARFCPVGTQARNCVLHAVISTKRTPCARGEISCIAFAQAWRSFDCAALQAASLRMTGRALHCRRLCFWKITLQKVLCSPHPSLRDTFPPRGRNGMKNCCACPTLWPSPLARGKVAAKPSDEGCPALFTRRGRTVSAARETLQS